MKHIAGKTKGWERVFVVDCEAEQKIEDVYEADDEEGYIVRHITEDEAIKKGIIHDPTVVPTIKEYRRIKFVSAMPVKVNEEITFGVESDCKQVGFIPLKKIKKIDDDGYNKTKGD